MRSPCQAYVYDLGVFCFESVWTEAARDDPALGLLIDVAPNCTDKGLDAANL